ncbi:MULTISPECIES: SDR family oxidoreductase [Burkholderia]|uniref:Short-chain dehydrogenase/reductase SDR n=1 Tax=Burkholderia orbicola (strain MC0-3) TaxID=406425 RepID=B1KCN9_BURO0|nr:MULTISPECIES: SDR family oxidoreductase [Burkholderia]ACA95986.1 short-chain dehydrogenase/reductase SDR [Burkholderia orbicola MC0-3]KWU23679.1 short-chain dehydrogenase [Burkholderia cenocepacia]MBY4798478.1 SDR family oxidoreductase [Burkholderia cepacia]RQV54360.1 SDR family oxidoreductase [Burkholderia cenocepacia]CAG2361872.1 short-chain dehydrogenase [Burkholderia cenocepacia]
MQRVKGKIAIVTGAASGIGAACAARLAHEGASVVVADLNLEGAQEQVRHIADSGGHAVAARVDIGDECSIEALFDLTLKTWGGLDILHNNAAATSLSSTADAAIEAIDVAVWDDTMRINLRGTMLASRRALPLMRSRGGGSIINTSSGAAQAGALGYSAYGVCKAGIENLTRYIAAQYGKEGIRCNAIAPGLIVTPVTRAYYAGELGEMMLSHHLTPRLGVPEDIAHAVVYLASDEAAFVTGQVFNVDGGLLSHQPYHADEIRARAAAAANAAKGMS